MITVILKKEEYIDNALRKLKKLTEKTGLIKELKQRRRYEKPSRKKQKKYSLALKRFLKKKKLLKYNYKNDY